MGVKEGWKGKLVEWVEKASFKKIRQLLEVSEREHHYKVLLTLKNLADVRRNPTCHNLPMIPRLLPSEVVVGEHFVNVDLMHLISSGASTFGGVEIEIADRRSVAWSRQGRLPLIAGILGQLNHRLDVVKGVVHLNSCLYLAGEESLPPKY